MTPISLDTRHLEADRRSFLCSLAALAFICKAGAPTAPGASAHMNFSGTGVTCLAAKGPGLGGIEIYLDGSSKAWVNLRLDDFPLLSRVTVLRVPGLESGQHSIRVVARGPGAVILNGFEVLGPI